MNIATALAATTTTTLTNSFTVMGAVLRLRHHARCGELSDHIIPCGQDVFVVPCQFLGRRQKVRDRDLDREYLRPVHTSYGVSSLLKVLERRPESTLVALGWNSINACKRKIPAFLPGDLSAVRSFWTTKVPRGICDARSSGSCLRSGGDNISHLIFLC